jgi:hypothetical protein
MNRTPWPSIRGHDAHGARRAARDQGPDRAAQLTRSREYLFHPNREDQSASTPGRLRSTARVADRNAPVVLPRLTVAERTARDKTARVEVPRSSHAVFEPAARLGLEDATTEAGLLQVAYGRARTTSVRRGMSSPRRRETLARTWRACRRRRGFARLTCRHRRRSGPIQRVSAKIGEDDAETGGAQDGAESPEI